MSAAHDGPQRLAATLSLLDERLDWQALGQLYCHEGGEDFFSPEDREAIQDTGLRLAGDVAESISVGAGGSGRSLYVGAAVAELPILLCESLVLGRRVVISNRAGPEVTALNEALAGAEQDLGWKLPRFGIEGVPPKARAAWGSFDHIWMVSVLTDPEAFPALHDQLYARTRSELGTGRGDRVHERGRARSMVQRLLDCLDPPAILSTTDEELELVAESCQREGLELIVPERARLSGIVGDAVRVCRVRRT